MLSKWQPWPGCPVKSNNWIRKVSRISDSIFPFLIPLPLLQDIMSIQRLSCGSCGVFPLYFHSCVTRSLCRSPWRLKAVCVSEKRSSDSFATVVEGTAIIIHMCLVGGIHWQQHTRQVITGIKNNLASKSSSINMLWSNKGDPRKIYLLIYSPTLSIRSLIDSSRVCAPSSLPPDCSTCFYYKTITQVLTQLTIIILYWQIMGDIRVEVIHYHLTPSAVVNL